MAHDPFAQFPPGPPDEDALFGMDTHPTPPFEFEDRIEFEDRSPSLAIILISSATGIGFGVIGMYVAYQLLGLNIQISAGLATLAASVGLGLAGSLLSAISGSRAAVANIFFSCGLLIATVIFFGLCTIVGAIAATFVLSIGS